MKHSLLVSLAAIVVSVPAISTAQMATWGQLELEYGYGFISGIDGNANSIADTNPDSASLDGKLGADFGKYGVQLDLNYTDQFIDDNDYTGYANGNLAALHFNYDISPALSMGIVAGLGSTQPANDPEATFNFYALEGAYDLGSYTIMGQIGAFDAEDSSMTDAFHNGTFARVTGAYMLSASAYIDAEIGYFAGKQDNGGSYDMTAITWGVGYSRQIGSRPMVWSVGLEGGNYTNGNGGDNGTFMETRATVGLTMWFGGGSAYDMRTRTIFDTPDFARIVVAGNSID